MFPLQLCVVSDAKAAQTGGEVRVDVFPNGGKPWINEARKSGGERRPGLAGDRSRRGGVLVLFADASRGKDEDRLVASWRCDFAEVTWQWGQLLETWMTTELLRRYRRDP